VSSSGYICQFKDLQVRSVLLDEIMPTPDEPELDCIVVTEAKVSCDAACSDVDSVCFFAFCSFVPIAPLCCLVFI